ncbi:hypothetical protein [Burkholderia sp. Bp8998]|uniref:hypothetical protein n=1 Tax=Burkholderia sp. Bp8998 TaxID=2184557 RepID=UPI000F595921|nr:hypothetical protein [Burkholderia sp. Bp8998]
MNKALHRVARTLAVSNTVQPAWRKINKKIFGREWKLFGKSETEIVRFNDEHLMECGSIYLRNYIGACHDFLNNGRVRRRGGREDPASVQTLGVRIWQRVVSTSSFSVAAPTGHHRTPTPKPDHNGGVCGAGEAQ